MYQGSVPVCEFDPCRHRSVSEDGRIVCCKIVEGDNTVSHDVCRRCPSKAVDCVHLHFSLVQVAPSPLVVRFNGRTEIWDDDPPELRFERAACAARVIPIEGPRSCEGCDLHQAVCIPADQLRHRQGQVASAGSLVPLAPQDVLVATG